MRNVFVLIDGTSLVLADKSNIKSLLSASQAAGHHKFYQPGVGAFSRVGATVDQLLAPNMEPQALLAYEALVAYDLSARDRLFIFGYSRGAVIARTLAMCIASHKNLIATAPSIDWPTYRGPRFETTIPAQIEFLCLFDPVEGWPRLIEAKVPNHNAVLELGIRHYLEILAAEEPRVSYLSDTYSRSGRTSRELAALSRADTAKDREMSFKALALRKTRKVVWFPGKHADVGGHGQEELIGAHTLATAMQELESITKNSGSQISFPDSAIQEIRSKIASARPIKKATQFIWLRRTWRQLKSHLLRRKPAVDGLIPHLAHPICEERANLLPDYCELPRYMDKYRP